MLSPDQFEEIYLYRPVVDFRQGIRGLTVVIQEEMELSPFKKYLFLFCNRGRDKIKAVYWDKTGFAMWYKILEKDKFPWPRHLDRENISVDVDNLHKFLQGLNPWQLPHKEVHYEKV